MIENNQAEIEFDNYRKNKQQVSCYNDCMICNKENRLIQGICKECYIKLRINMHITGLTSEENEIITEVIK